MARHKVRELPGAIQHLPAYVPPPADRIRYSDIWRRAMTRWKPGLRVFVEEVKKK